MQASTAAPGRLGPALKAGGARGRGPAAPDPTKQARAAAARLAPDHLPAAALLSPSCLPAYVLTGP